MADIMDIRQTWKKKLVVDLICIHISVSDHDPLVSLYAHTDKMATMLSNSHTV